MAEDVEPQVVVVDNGTGSCKAGMAGDDAPRVVFSSLVGRPKHKNYLKDLDHKDTFIGDEAQTKRSMLSLKYPMEHGIVTDWDDMEKIWHYAVCDQLKVNTQETPMLMTDAVFNPKANKEKMTQILFETFDIPSLYIGLQPHMSFYAIGSTSGIVCEVGAGVLQIMPIYEGYSMPNSIQRVDLGGQDLDNYLCKLLAERGYSFCTTAERELVRELKEELCYVAEDYEVELSTSSEEQTYTLPDGQTVTLGNETFRCAEALFKPSLFEMTNADTPGMHQLLYNCLQKCDIDTRGDLYCQLLLTGGTSRLPGIKERMQKEMRQLIPPTMKMGVRLKGGHQYAAWIGGSILGSLSSFVEQVMTKKSYEEFGPGIVHMKMF